MLFQLGIAGSTFKTSNGNEKGNIEEILTYYDNSEGNISFGIKRKNLGHSENVNFFPFIFRNLAKYFDGKLSFYFAFKGVLGTAVNLEYLGSIPTLPSLSGNSSNTRWQLSLANAARDAILKTKISSYRHPSARSIFYPTNQTLAHKCCFPIVLRMNIGDDDLVTFFALLEMIDALKDPNLTSRQIDRIRLNFATRFSERIPALICYSRFLTHLTFNCYDFFDGIGKFRISHSGSSQPNEEQT